LLGTTLAREGAPSRRLDRRYLARERQQPVQIDGAVDGVAETAKLLGIEHALGCRHQPGVWLRERQRRVAGDGAEWRRAARVGDRVEHRAAVGLAAHAVGADAGEIQRWVQALEAANHGRGAAGRRPGVHDQQDGRAQPLRDLRRRARVAPAVDAVEAPHHALDHREVGATRVARDTGQHRLTSAHPAVEVVRRAPRGERVEARIDEVGPRLERLDPEAAPSQRFEEPERDRGLAHPGHHPRDHERTRGHHRRSGAGFAGATSLSGEASEGASTAPSDWLTPADLNVAISRQMRAAARARWMKSAAPVPSPRRSARSRYGVSPRCSSITAWPGSAERCEAKSAWRASGASVTATSAAAPEIKPSRTTGTRRAAPARITPTSPAISKPPTLARTSRPSRASGTFTASARRTTSTLRASVASSTPVPRPVTRSGPAPVIAAAIALAAVVLPIPISPVA